MVAALRSCQHIPIIAEIKRASPSAGSLKTEVNVAELAQLYARGGASALSVLTDGPYFGGSLEDLKEARSEVSLPILRKDFIIDPIQIYESRIAGADAVLLIAAALSGPELEALFVEARDFRMTPLVEVHGEEELEPVLALNPHIVGVNNRDLSTLEVSLETCVRIRPLIPPDVLVVGESGIQGPEDVKRLRNAGLDAFLIGTTLMRAKDPQAELSRMCDQG
jgi:indole-3-glycerol phosphate synthase